MSVRDPVVTERWALAVLRVSLGVFLLLWGVEKFVIPAATVGIWGAFYGVTLAAGLWRRVTYGSGLLLHAVSVFSSWRQLIDPWGLRSGGSPNHLFLAGIPVLAGFVALYLMRTRDRWTLDEWILRQRKP